MNNAKEQIDFIVGRDFYNYLEAGKDIIQGETFMFFAFIDYLFRLYKILNLMVGTDKTPDVKELEVMGVNSWARRNLVYNYAKEKHVYRFIYAIMLNKIDEVKETLDNKIVDLHFNPEKTTLFKYASERFGAFGFSYLNIAAALGRKEICRYLIEKNVDTEIMVILYRLKAYPIPLSVNECLLMNVIFKWYKSGKKKIQKKETEELIDIIILASRKSPSIVSNDHLLDIGIRVTYYWMNFKRIVEDVNLLKELIPLNEKAINDILNA